MAKTSFGKDIRGRFMIVIITRWLIITVAILLASRLPGITVDSLPTAVIAAGILGLVNIFIRPVLVFLTLPLSILTLGLFYFFINAFLLEFVAHLVGSGFKIDNFFSALLGSLIISLVSWLANSFIATHKIEKKKSPEYIDLEKGDDGKWR
jgi:putative membrane protein